MSGLWRNRDFLRFWFGESVSLVGSQVTSLALPLTAIEAFHASDRQVGLLRFLQLVPYLALAMLFGVWVDRVRRRHVMLGANLARLVLITAVPVLHWLGLLSLTPLLVIACAIGVASVLFDVSWMSYVPTLVEDPVHYVEASAKLATSSSAADIAGPGLAGVLIGALTAPVALVVDAVSYLVSIGTLLRIRAREPRPVPTGRKVRTEFGDGLRWVFGNPVLRALALIGFCCNFSMITVWTMFLLYGSRNIGLAAPTIGGIFAVASAGGLTGAALSRRVIRRVPLGRAYVVAQSLLLIGPALIPWAGPASFRVVWFGASFFLTYLGLGVAGVIIVSLRQVLTPAAMMGRMTAVFRTLLFGGGALGGLAAGLASDAFGPRQALIIAAIGSGAVIPAVVVSPVRRLRALPEPAAVTPAGRPPTAGAPRSGGMFRPEGRSALPG